MILSRHERDCPLAVSEDEQRQLLAFHELLDEDRCTGCAERPVAEHGLHGDTRFLDVMANDDPLARRETGRLDHDRCAEVIERAQRVLHGRADHRPRCWNAGGFHEGL